MSPTDLRCAVCGGAAFAQVTSVARSALVDVDGALEPRRRVFDIGRCRTCEHVQVSSPQTERALLELYQTYIYRDARAPEPRRYPGDRRAPPPVERTWAHYVDLVAFCQPYVLAGAGAIIDLGCGPGDVLRYLRDTYRIAPERLVGIDFLPHLSPEHGIDLIVADLNALDETSQLAPLTERVGFAFCCHVLEHMLEPRRFLRFVRALLPPDAHFYVEVPDHTVTQPRNVPGTPEYIPLVVPEHLQYFSLPSLVSLVESSGFEVVKSERVQSYDGFLPRLKLLLRPAQPRHVADVVAYCVDRNDGHWPAVAARAAATIRAERSALWGCGYGLLQMLGADPELATLIRAREVAVFDSQHAGKSFLAGTIRDQAELATFTGTAILTPALPASRDAMKARAAELGVRVVDPYPASSG